jgi:prepilin-type N-terminal cleavage/methylation domain-containing protein
LNSERSRGFTLIETMVVVALAAIILGLGVPTLRDVIVRNKIASASNDFNLALQQTRALAISRNTCAMLCASSNVVASATGVASTTVCDADAATNNFLTGYLIFENPTCNAALRDPVDAVNKNVLNRAYKGDNGSDGYSLVPGTAALSTVMFDPRGFASLGAVGQFQVSPPAGTAASFRRTICIDVAGRATVRAYTSTC